MMRRALAVGLFVLVALSLSAPVASAGGGCHTEEFTDATGLRVDLRDLCFTPTVIRVQPGQSVTWTNQDSFDHTVTGAANGWGSPDSLAAGASVSFRFRSSGVYPYACLLHPGMVGAVVVGDGTSASTTAQAVVPVAPPATSIAPPVASSVPAPAPAETSGGVSSLWRVLAIAAFAMFAVALAGAAALRVASRRAEVRA